MQSVPATEIFLRWCENRRGPKEAFAEFRKQNGGEMPVPHQNWAGAFLAIVGLTADDCDAWLEFYRAHEKHVRKDERLRPDAIKIAA